MPQEPPPPRLALGIFLSLAAYIFFVSASSLVFRLHTQIPVMQIIFIQNGICFFSLLPLILRKGKAFLKTPHFSAHLWRDLSGVGSYICYFFAIRDLNLTDATTLNYTAPFFVPLVWWIWTKEKIHIHVWWSIILGFMGVLVILNPTSRLFEEGFAFGLGAGIASSIAFAALRILNLKQEPTSRTLFYYFLAGSLLSAPFSYSTWIWPEPTQWACLIGIGLATTVAQMLLTIAYRYGSASYLAPFGYSTVIYAALISWLIFDIPLSLRSFLGSSLIVLGGTLTYLLKKKPAALPLNSEKSMID